MKNQNQFNSWFFQLKQLTNNQLVMKKTIKRPGDLAPLGVRSTVKSNCSFNETYAHIFNESRKPDELWAK